MRPGSFRSDWSAIAVSLSASLEVLLSYFGNKTGKYQAPFGTFLNQNMFTEKKLYLRQGRHVIFLRYAQVVLRGCVI